MVDSKYVQYDLMYCIIVWFQSSLMLIYPVHVLLADTTFNMVSHWFWNASAWPRMGMLRCMAVMMKTQILS